MKAELELTISDMGSPKIKIKHWDKSSELEQKLLGVFIKKAMLNGLRLVSVSGHLETGTSNSWENYEIIVE